MTGPRDPVELRVAALGLRVLTGDRVTKRALRSLRRGVALLDADAFAAAAEHFASVTDADALSAIEVAGDPSGAAFSLATQPEAVELALGMTDRLRGSDQHFAATAVAVGLALLRVEDARQRGVMDA